MKNPPTKKSYRAAADREEEMISVLGGSHFWNLELAGKGRHKFSALTRGSKNLFSCPEKKKKALDQKKTKREIKRGGFKRESQTGSSRQGRKIKPTKWFDGQQTKRSVLGAVLTFGNWNRRVRVAKCR